MQVPERSYFLYDDREEKTMTVKAKFDRNTKKWIGDCPFHVHGRPSLEIDHYKETYFCKDCLTKGRLWNKEELNHVSEEFDEPAEVLSLGECLLMMIEQAKKGEGGQSK